MLVEAVVGTKQTGDRQAKPQCQLASRASFACVGADPYACFSILPLPWDPWMVVVVADGWEREIVRIVPTSITQISQDASLSHVTETILQCLLHRTYEYINYRILPRLLSTHLLAASIIHSPSIQRKPNEWTGWVPDHPVTAYSRSGQWGLFSGRPIRCTALVPYEYVHTVRHLLVGTIYLL